MFPISEGVDNATDTLDPREVALHGIPLPGCDPWRWFPVLLPEQILRAADAYAPFLRDGESWLTLAGRFTAGLFFEHPDGWLLADNLRPGLSAEIHGTSYSGHSHLDVDSGLDTLFTHLLTNYDLQALNAFLPTHAVGAQRWLERHGFSFVGLAPFNGLWHGEPKHIHIYTLYRKRDNSQSQEPPQEPSGG
jgi:hypothetical protein